MLLKRLAGVKDHVGIINLADNALGRVKMSGLVFASMIKARLGSPVVLNFSCRDRNRFALKSDLLGARARSASTEWSRCRVTSCRPTAARAHGRSTISTPSACCR